MQDERSKDMARMVARESVRLLVQHFREFAKPFDAKLTSTDRGTNVVVDPSLYAQCMQDVQNGVSPNLSEAMKRNNLESWRTIRILRETQNCLRYIFTAI